jgi:undecaprenyl-diphosphatase
MNARLQLRAAHSAAAPNPMDNIHLFELLNAGPGLGGLQLALSVLLAKWLIVIVPVGMGAAWRRAEPGARRDLLEMLIAVLVALALAQLVAHVWPQPRPFVLHLGTQYLDHAADPGLPSDHVTMFWSLALSAFATRRFAVWGFPLLAIGLVVGWSRVFLGVHFPYDVVAALPVALVGALAARALRGPVGPFVDKLLHYHDRLEQSWRAWRATKPKA